MTPVKITGIWPLIQDQVAAIMDGENITPDEIRLECEAGNAACFASKDGVVIVRHEAIPRGDGKTQLFIVLGVSMTAEHGAYRRQRDALDQIARDLGASRIVFNTSRIGWARLLEDGWRVAHVQWVRDLDG